ncbi:hypothetical protein ACFLSQ_05570, partial [Bacteroidota bacterium]
MLKRIFKYIILFISLFLLLESNLFSQSIFDVDRSDSLTEVPSNRINYGVDKIVNTYIFRGIASLNFPVFWGNIEVNQRYTGTAMKTSTDSFWDDEIFNFKYIIPVADNLSLKLNQDWLYYSSDSGSKNLNKVEEIRGTGGMKYLLTDISGNENSFLESSVGLEKNSQREIDASGPVFNFRGKLDNYNIEQYLLSANLLGEYVSLNDNRKRGLFDVRSSLMRNYDKNNNIRIDVRYKSFLYPE